MGKIYFVTARARWFYRDKPLITKYKPLEVDADYMQCMAMGFSHKNLDGLSAHRRRRECFTLIGTREDILSRVAGLKDEDFEDVKTTSWERDANTALYLEWLVNSIPSPAEVFTRFLDKEVSRGRRLLAGIPLTAQSERGIKISENTKVEKSHPTSAEFLHNYLDILRYAQRIGVDVDGDAANMSTDDLARKLLYKEIVEHLGLDALETEPYLTVESLRAGRSTQ